MTSEEVAFYASTLPQEEKNQLIQLVVGDQPVIMNIDVMLKPKVYQLTKPLLIGGTAQVSGFNTDCTHRIEDI